MDAADHETLWEDFDANPFDGSYSQGQENGRIDGQEAGYRDGYAIGRTTALNYGLEIGYIHGLLNELQHYFSTQAHSDDKITIHQSRRDRIGRSIDNLRLALDEFPTASEMMVSSKGKVDRNTSIHDGFKDKPNDLEATADDDMDVDAKMQCIRARFKLLRVQIDPHSKLQLSVILSDALLGSSSAVESTPVDSSLAANHQDQHSW
jgi:hypothetical protein